jgi:2,4-didehydro-3-deoxy-L-rhamnonate hydrolase
MRLANVKGRAAIITSGGAVDVEQASAGLFGSGIQELYAVWHQFRGWAATIDTALARPWAAEDLGPPAPAPRQIFAVGLNYVAHAAEGGFEVPSAPSIFTKFASCLTGPCGAVELPEGKVDWEVELVVVMAERVRHIPVDEVWPAVAGITAGQDISERVTQHRPPVPQFSMGKSFPGFGPTGPVLVTPDEVPDPDDIELTTVLNGQIMQRARTSEMVFDVPALISYLSTIVTLLPGDLIFTGTPPGVGKGRNPPRFLASGDVLETAASGIGRMHHTFVAP